MYVLKETCSFDYLHALTKEVQILTKRLRSERKRIDGEKCKAGAATKGMREKHYTQQIQEQMVKKRRLRYNVYLL